MKIFIGKAYLEHETIRQQTVSTDGDVIPPAKSFSVPQYEYLSYVYVPEKNRGRGVAKKLIAQLLSLGTPVYTKLVDSDVTQGMTLLPMLKKMGFKVLSRRADFATLILKP